MHKGVAVPAFAECAAHAGESTVSTKFTIVHKVHKIHKM